jgi:hypothetical protein
MTKEEQVALTTRFVEHANEFLDALRELFACLQYGDPYRGLPNTPIKQAARDVRSAELRDIEDLIHRMRSNWTASTDDRGCAGRSGWIVPTIATEP